MIYSVLYKSEAIADLKEIHEWYQAISKEVSIQFQKSIKLAELNLSRMPFAYAQLNLKHFRRIVLDNFPYKIIYYIKKETKIVYIFAILHTARSHKFIKRKIK